MEKSYGKELNMEDTELRLGLPGSDIEEGKHSSSTCSSVRSNKRPSPEAGSEGLDSTLSKTNSNNSDARTHDQETVDAPLAKVQVVGWPPVRSCMKNSLQQEKIKSEESGRYVKVSMTDAPYLRKIDLKAYSSYPELLKELENMFKCTFGEYSEREGYDESEYVPTYEDKDGDWMLVGDVPWKMFISSCKRLRIMKGSEAKGLGCL